MAAANMAGKQPPEYRAWSGAKQRCGNPNVPSYGRYGGRGINVCERWRDSYENFIADMGPKPSQAHSLDRYPDNDGDYEPTNCRWAIATEQARNRRNNPSLRDVPPSVGVKRVTLVASGSWWRNIDEWRRQQDLPTFSEAWRRLIEAGLDATTKKSGRK